MKDLSNIMLIEFEDVGVPMYAVFNITQTTEEEVLKYLKDEYPVVQYQEVMVVYKSQWDTIFNK